MKLEKIELDLKFDKKRKYELTTPCCNRSNRDGKFVNYTGLDKQYGYCHSCGKASLPPTLYLDENGNKYTWNDQINRYEKVDGSILNSNPKSNILPVTTRSKEIMIKYIEPFLVKESVLRQPENNLLTYIRNTYGDKKTDKVIDLYYLGTDQSGYTMFWNIDKNQMVRKVKAIAYSATGKRTSMITSPFLNEQGYKACLFGEHLLKLGSKNKDVFVLVESEKTAVIASIEFPQYKWLAYGGINGLTKEKMKVLKGYRTLIIPDMSKNAVSIINKKIQIMEEMGIDVKMWDLTGGRTDEQLKEDNEYNNDLEDILKKQNHEN